MSLFQKLESLQQLLDKITTQKLDIPSELHQSLIRLQNECNDLTQEKLLHDERIEALEHMASNITHNFNNIFSPVLGLTELLLSRQDYIENKEKCYNYLQLINNAALEGTQTLESLRKFYRDSLEEETFVQIELAPLLEKFIEANCPNWKARSKGLVIKTSLENDVFIQGNKIGLEEAFGNVIDNAIDAMPQGGSLLVELSKKEKAIVKISDTGTGMKQKHCLVCLEPFFTTKTSQNLGLGLSIAYGIFTKRHLGKIEIQSRLEKGTTVTVQLPSCL